MELIEHVIYGQSYPHRWYFVYLRGETISIFNSTMFSCNKPKPSQPGCYLAKLKGLPVVIILFKNYLLGDGGYAVLLRDKQTLRQILQIKEQQG